MDRRQFLAIALGTLPLAGCLTGSSGETGRTITQTTPTNGAYRIEPTATLTYNGETVLTRIDRPFAQRAVGPYYLAMCTTASHADHLADQLTEDDGQRFLTETDFESAVVIVLQDATGQSTPDFVVNGAELGQTAITLDVEYPGQGATADITQDMLFVRLSPDGRPVEHATVTIRDMGGGRQTISTVGRYDRPKLAEPGDLVVRNRDCTTYRVDVAATIDEELVYTNPRHEVYPAGTIVRHRDAFTHGGSYQITASTAADEPTTADITLGPNTGTDVQSVVIDIDGDGIVSINSRPEGELPTEGTIECASTTLPYESTDPTENLADPARIVWVNRSQTTRTLAITVSNGETTILDRELILRSGGKGRTEGLIAKTGVYQTVIDSLDGGNKTIEWHVDEQNPDLQLHIDSSGTLQVATASQR